MTTRVDEQNETLHEGSSLGLGEWFLDSPTQLRDPIGRPRGNALISKFGPYVVLLLTILAIFVWWGQANQRFGQDSPAIGKPAPQVDLVLLSNQPELSRIADVAKNQVTLLHCWGTWCGPCQMEYPDLSQMAHSMENEGQLRFLSVSCESGPHETFESLWGKTQNYFEGAEIQSTAYADPRGLTRRSICERLERERMFYPTSIVIDAEGAIAGVWEGYTPSSVYEIKKTIDRLAQ